MNAELIDYYFLKVSYAEEQTFFIDLRKVNYLAAISPVSTVFNFGGTEIVIRITLAEAISHWRHANSNI